jgi:hypothetical protein
METDRLGKLGAFRERGPVHGLADGFGTRSTRRPARVSFDGIRLGRRVCPHQFNENKVYQGNGS